MGDVTINSGNEGRLPAPPKGEMYIRDPEAARAQAIRERVAMYKGQGKPVPEHLQHLFDTLPEHEKTDIELVDAKTGRHISDVQVSGPGRTKLATMAAPEESPMVVPPGPFTARKAPEPEPVVVDPAPAPEPVIEAVAAPKPVEPVAPVEPVKPVEPVVPPKLANPPQTGTGELTAQADAILRAQAKAVPAPPAPPARKQPGRPRKATPTPR